MIGQRNSLFFTIVTNPLIWIGVILGILHLRTVPDDVWQVFSTPQTYVNLLLGSTIWTLTFDRHYTKNREKLAIAENLLAIITNAYIIFFVWGSIVFVVSEYHQSGLQYSQTLRERLQEEKQLKNERLAPVLQTSGSINIEKGKRYKLTPNTDGSFILEVLDN